MDKLDFTIKYCTHRTGHIAVVKERFIVRDIIISAILRKCEVLHINSSIFDMRYKWW